MFIGLRRSRISKKQLKYADEQYISISSIKGKARENALQCMELYTVQYKKEYEQCEQIMKM